MDIQASEIVAQTSTWSPNLIVSLIKEIAWPIVALLLGYRFKTNIAKGLSSFFSKNEVEEVSAGATGVTARFRAAQQNADTKDLSSPTIPELPEGLDYESLRKTHTDNSTVYSEYLYEQVRQHLNALPINDQEKIDLLTKETSILQASIKYLSITKILFRSQFDLFSNWMNEGASVSQKDAENYFNKLVSNDPDGYTDWDVSAYMGYPVEVGVVECKDDSYLLTDLGNSLVAFLRKYPEDIERLTKL